MPSCSRREQNALCCMSQWNWALDSQRPTTATGGCAQSVHQVLTFNISLSFPLFSLKLIHLFDSCHSKMIPYGYSNLEESTTSILLLSGIMVASKLITIKYFVYIIDKRPWTKWISLTTEILKRLSPRN